MPKMPKSQEVDQAELLAFLKANLSLNVGQPIGGFTDPNARRIELVLDGEVISAVEFNVVQTREYRG